VLIPALMLTTIVDALGARLFGSGIYAEEMAAGHFAPWLWLGNLLSLQDIFVSYWGTNSALWTLSHEYWNYLTFPLLCMPLMRELSLRARIAGFAAGVMLLAVMSVTGSWHFFGFLLWVAGALAILPTRPLMKSKWLALGLFLAVSVGCRLAFRFAELQQGYLGHAVDVALALTFANVLLTLRFASAGWRLLDWRGHVRLSEFSYSLYAIHMPIITFLCAAAQHQFGIGWRNVPTSAAHWIVAAGIFAIAVAASWAFSRVTEARTAAVRGWFVSFLREQPRKSPALRTQAG
jgi:peptidoglycan/LPS O-acetylase OafA/YrhL